MSDVELNIMKCESRIRKLKANPIVNEHLIKKAERNLRKYQAKMN